MISLRRHQEGVRRIVGGVTPADNLSIIVDLVGGNVGVGCFEKGVVDQAEIHFPLLPIRCN